MATPTQRPAANKLLLDVFDEFESLRRDQPVLHLEDVGIWLVSRYKDCIRVIRDSDTFTSMNIEGFLHPVPAEFAGELPNGYPVSFPALVNNDPPGHTRIRKLAQKALSPSAVARHEPVIRSIADGLIDHFAERGTAELVAEFARPFPCTVLATVLGIPQADQNQFVRWGLAVHELLSPFTTEERRFELAGEQVAFRRYLAEQIAEHKADPSLDDIIGGLVHARADEEPALTDPELMAIIAQLIVAGFETTMAGVVNTIMLLIQHPDALAAVRADPAKIPAAVEESLRRLPPARGVLRQTTREVVIGDSVIPSGARICALLASANHDEEQFSCPAEYQIDRPSSEQRQHVAFGQGTHFCIGGSLAKLEICTAVELLLQRLPDLRFAADQQLEWAAHAENFFLQTPSALTVEWGGRVPV